MDALLKLLPPVRRIRGNRLYLADGRRLLDLYLDDGHLILGDAEKHSRTYARNAVEKGLTRAYPGLYEQRLRKALLALWPQFKEVRFFYNEDRAIAAALRCAPVSLLPASENTGGKSAAPTAAQTGGTPLLRPFLAVPAGTALALARLPCARPFAPGCLLAADPALLADIENDLVPAMQFSAATRALDSLTQADAEGYNEAHWQSFAAIVGDFFRRDGPYLYPRLSDSQPVGLKSRSYEDFFRAALAADTLLSPDPQKPCIVPPDFDYGEAQKLGRALSALFS